MKKQKLTYKMLALAMSLCMIFTMMPMAAHATTHEHDASCGYAPASECTHTHDGTCGYAEAVAGAACNHAHGDCSFIAASDGTPCGHSHDTNCGYVEAKPCSFTPCDHSTCGYVAESPCNGSEGCDHLETDNCGYVEGTDCPNDGQTCDHSTCGYTEGSPCNHTEHTDCGYSAPVEGVACDHSHNANCGYVEAVEAQPCTHAHDTTCGYAAGSDCTYVEPVADTNTYTITYTDGVGGSVFADQVYTAEEGGAFPYFDTSIGSLERAGYIYDGWTPDLVTTVTADATYTAVWRACEGHPTHGWYESDETNHWSVCACGYILPDSIEAHSWAWKYNDEYHWQVCECLGMTGEEVGENAAAHSYSDDSDASCDCGYSRVVEPEHTHSYTAVVTAPTCKEQGYTTYTCSCNDSYVSDYVDALGHDWGDCVSIGNGRHKLVCGNDSSHEQTTNCGGRATCHELAFCSDCKTTYGEYDQDNHSGGTEVRNAKKATETENGYTGDTYCLGCNVLISEGSIIYATGSGDDDDDTHTHNYSYYKFDGTNHWKMCHCGQGQAGSVKPHSLVITGASTGHVEECTVCNYFSDVEAHVYSDDSDAYCNECGYRRHVHDQSTAATCKSPAKCSCGVTTGGKDPTNHTGGTEIRNAKEATRTETGYTGDTYCLGCGSMIASGEVIPKAGVIFDGPGVEDVTFIPAEGTELPRDAEIIVNPHTPSGDDLDFVLGIDADTEYLDADDVKIQIVGGGVYTAPDGTKYSMYEIILINGEEYLITNYMGTGDVLGLMRLSDGATCGYKAAVNVLDFTGSINGTVQDYAYDKVNIGGVTYDVKLSYANAQGTIEVILYYNGSPAAKLRNYEACYFLEGFDPETLKAQQNVNDLGTVTTGENPIDGLESGKTYNVSVIGSNDIHLEGAENVSGTVTQTFDIPNELVGKTDVTFVAVHNTNPHATALAAAKYKMEEAIMVYWEYHGDSAEERQRLYEAANRASMEWQIVQEHYDAWEKEHAADNKTGNDLGIVTISEDGKTLTTTYTVSSFSPFTVYAFVEADEPEIKTLSATIVDGSDDTTEAPDTNEPVVSPQTSDSWIWYVLVAVVAGAIAVASVVYGKRRKSKAN